MHSRMQRREDLVSASRIPARLVVVDLQARKYGIQHPIRPTAREAILDDGVQGTQRCVQPGLTFPSSQHSCRADTYASKGIVVYPRRMESHFFAHTNTIHVFKSRQHRESSKKHMDELHRNGSANICRPLGLMVCI